MNISIFHYHLNPGGVTRIIESQVASFKMLYPNCRIQVITGYCENEKYYTDLNVEVKIYAKLNYLVDKDFENNDLNELYNELYNWLKKQINDNEILHVHNLNLGKNPIITMVFNALLSDGYSVVNHAHDFAEDRPVNMQFLTKIIENRFNKNLSNVLYPDNEKYLIGVLNQFDYDRVISYNIPENRLFLWPNPVHVNLKTKQSKRELRKELIDTFGLEDKHQIITYPVRVIRRKNIGELILLAYLFTDTCRFLVTLPPRNPVEIEFYNKWLELCQSKNIPVVFEAGTKTEFETIVCGSDCCITTSIKEGFGMSYLEPWLMGTPVIGRNINYVTSDIKEKGVKFPLLYNELIVQFKNKTLDFKDLEFVEQVEYITQLAAGNIKKEDVIQENDFLKTFPLKIKSSAIIENQNTIKKEFSLEKYAERIYQAYSTIS